MAHTFSLYITLQTKHNIWTGKGALGGGGAKELKSRSEMMCVGGGQFLELFELGGSHV